jgi:hypothetical protein
MVKRLFLHWIKGYSILAPARGVRLPFNVRANTANAKLPFWNHALVLARQALQFTGREVLKQRRFRESQSHLLPLSNHKCDQL